MNQSVENGVCESVITNTGIPLINRKLTDDYCGCIEAAIAEISHGKGIKYDIDVVDATLKLIKKNKLPVVNQH